MKKVSYLFATLILTAIIFTGCSKVKELADVKFNVNYDTDLKVVVPLGARTAGFDVETQVDPTADEEVQKYLDKIKGFEIQQMSAKVKEISKDVTLVTADFSVFTDDKNATWHMENLPLTVGATIQLGNENGQWNTVNQIFDEKTTFTVKLKGETDEDDVTFIIEVSMVVKIIANPLD